MTARDLPEDEQAIVETVARWVDREVRPHAGRLERAQEYPAALIDQMKEMGVFGLAVPARWSESAVSTRCFALVTAELARGWMSLAGAMGGHSVVARLLATYGTPEQQERWLPRMATGEVRAAMALTEPSGGSDLQDIRTRAVRDGDSYVVDGTKTWITNARHAGLIATLVKTDPQAQPRHRGISILLVEPGQVDVSRDLPKLGYRGVESCELSFAGSRVPAGALLGGEEGRGFGQFMAGLELGRVQVAARAVGVGQAALDDALAYAQQRETFGTPIWEHQSVGNLLADMATKVHASRLLVLDAAAGIDEGRRSDLEAGMAKLYASEACMQVALDAMRIHGAAGYSAELDVERYFRDAPLMIVGEGTNEIQRNVIVRRLVERSRET
ncbi:alkylation response protein AidB-like acyl-CoA dehydrogenase [Blastococcus colisei]|uniref:Alkylation response protein AidB-like acyl-CoA dehydrogenase n=1 Tax=Blastococcus colisei TaxID=1564162 RepID=A0A543P1E7_9ACTN|nr:acyl-CoA dehydrogenase family protein [Blastococcus colisei]TQN37843.1 alkylation response protein AidB-like acyl-CoA dehydrogenase [Blastococcus colisei]